MRLVLASSNHGKLVEIRGELSGLKIEPVPQVELGIVDADETASTFVENALLKARHAASASGLPALGDDSGICVDVLGGAPGLYSARYAGAHGDAQANIGKLLRELRDVPEARRTAHFYCVIVVLRSADDPMPLIAEGRWDGSILEAPRAAAASATTRFYDPNLRIGAAELEASIRTASASRPGRSAMSFSTPLQSWRRRSPLPDAESSTGRRLSLYIRHTVVRAQVSILRLQFAQCAQCNTAIRIRRRTLARPRSGFAARTGTAADEHFLWRRHAEPVHARQHRADSRRRGYPSRGAAGNRDHTGDQPGHGRARTFRRIRARRREPHQFWRAELR
jgi:XTP/dITP diphosphohydrolase